MTHTHLAVAEDAVPLVESARFKLQHQIKLDEVVGSAWVRAGGSEGQGQFSKLEQVNLVPVSSRDIH